MIDHADSHGVDLIRPRELACEVKWRWRHG
jgi:hypothetical protein